MTKHAVVLLSGGMDSTVALYWAIQRGYEPIDAITFKYGQLAHEKECAASVRIFSEAVKDKISGTHSVCHLGGAFTSSALLGHGKINTYDSVDVAIDNTPKDSSYIPMRNSVFLSVAAHYLLSSYPTGGSLVTGLRGRPAQKGQAPGFPDCTKEFATMMTSALTQGAGTDVTVLDPLNYHAPTREDTIGFARTLPGCWEALKFTVSCFCDKVKPCGKCLPCVRRADAFAKCGLKDPALE